MKQSLVNGIVEATGVKKNELVLVHFWGEDEDIAIMHMFSNAVVALGAAPLELQQSRTGNFRMFSTATQDSFSEKYYSLFSTVDAVLDLFCYQPVQLDQELDPAHMAYYRQHMAQLFRILVQAKRFSQIRLPSDQNAQESGLPPEEFRERMIAAYEIDYTKVQNAANDRVSSFKDKTELLLATPNGHELHFVLGDRQWHIDAGDGDMPCGEIYIAPIEEDTNGSVFFEKLYLDDIGDFDHIELIVEKGVIVHSNDDRVNDYLEKLNVSDKTVCELGFGMNPNITTLCGFTVLDEKASGTFHIAIGSNKMFGGHNESPIHVDFVGGAFSIK